MDTILKFGGKAPNNTAKAVSVDDSGKVNVVRTWNGVMTRVINESPRTTDVIISDAVDVSVFGLVSLRVKNTTDQDVTLNIYTDLSELGTGYMADAGYHDVSLVIGHGNRTIVITPDDIPCLPYLNSIKVRVAFSIAPTSGDLKVYVAGKR